jgi:hypothetical protein
MKLRWWNRKHRDHRDHPLPVVAATMFARVSRSAITACRLTDFDSTR